MIQKLKTIVFTFFCIGKIVLLYGDDNTNSRIIPRLDDGYNKPLVDRSGYTLVPELSDEFDGTKLNLNKWRPHMKNWKGRGAEFTPSNVSVKDGCLQLKSSIKDEQFLEEVYSTIDTALTGIQRKININTWSPADYGEKWDAKKLSSQPLYDNLQDLGLKAIGAAAVESRNEIAKAGYYEARIKISEIALSSSFWLIGGGTEFDITESMGTHTLSEESDWLTRTPYEIQSAIHYHNPPPKTSEFEKMKYLAPKKLTEEFFILGFLWDEAETKIFYNDQEIYGHDLSSIPEIDPKIFSSLKRMIFDCEVLWGPWKGWPTKAQLSNLEINTYHIDWVRVWEPKKNLQ